MHLHSFFLKWYKAVLIFYPRSYKDEYRSEMVTVFSDMLQETNSTSERVGLIVSATIEALPWIVRENSKLLAQSWMEIPLIIKRGFLTSGLFLAPFFLIVGHNAYNLRISKESISPLFQMIGHGWFIYTLILPILALFVTAFASAFYVKPRLLHAGGVGGVWHQVASVPFFMMLSLGAVELLILF